MTHRIVFFGGVLLLALTGRVSADELLMVFESTAAHIPVGPLPADHLVALEFGERIQVFDEAGVEYFVQGPYEGLPNDPELRRREGEAGDRYQKSMRQLMGPERIEMSNLGGVRGPVGGEASRNPPSPWLLARGYSGSHCVLDESPSLVAWADGTPPARLHVTDVYLETEYEVAWPDGSNQTRLPPEVNLRDDAVFLLRTDDELQSSAVRIRLVPASLPRDHRMAIWLASFGCGVQAQVLLGGLGQES